MKHLIQYSTGAASAEVAWRAVQENGAENVVLLSADTLAEHPDNWRFADEVARLLGCEWIILADGRTPMQVGFDEGLVPNDHKAICSRILKRELLWWFMGRHYGPADSVIYLGFDWSEPHRYKAAEPNWAPWAVRAPLMNPPYTWKGAILDAWRERGIEPPELYERNLGHANCSGCCVRGGIADWAKALQADRPTYLAWEAGEERIRGKIGKDFAILRDRHDGTTKALPLRVYRERRDSLPVLFGPDYSENFGAEDYGACGCFMAEEEPPLAKSGQQEPHRLILSATAAVSCSCQPELQLAAPADWMPGEYVAAWHDLHPREADGRYSRPASEGEEAA